MAKKKPTLDEVDINVPVKSIKTRPEVVINTAGTGGVVLFVNFRPSGGPFVTLTEADMDADQIAKVKAAYAAITAAAKAKVEGA